MRMIRISKTIRTSEATPITNGTCERSCSPSLITPTEDIMANQIFIMPLIGTGSRFNPTRPKYQMPAGYSQIRDGLAFMAIVVSASDYGPTFAPFDDVFVFPTDLDAPVTEDFQDRLNAFMGDFDFGVYPRGDEASYRVVIRRLGHWFLIAQRMQGNGGFNLESYGLNTTLDSIPLVESQSFIQSLIDLQVDHSDVKWDMTFQQAFYTVCTQFDTREIAGFERGVYGSP